VASAYCLLGPPHAFIRSGPRVIFFFFRTCRWNGFVAHWALFFPLLFFWGRMVVCPSPRINCVSALYVAITLQPIFSGIDRPLSRLCVFFFLSQIAGIFF